MSDMYFKNILALNIFLENAKKFSDNKFAFQRKADCQVTCFKVDFIHKCHLK